MSFWTWKKPLIPTADELLDSGLRKEYQESDFGRRYGWVLYLGNQRIADVNYLFWDASSQFWHAYRVVPTSPQFEEIGFDAKRWTHSELALESRFAEGYRIKEFMMAPRPDSVVMLRAACVPEVEFLKAVRAAQASGRAV